MAKIITDRHLRVIYGTAQDPVPAEYTAAWNAAASNPHGRREITATTLPENFRIGFIYNATDNRCDPPGNDHHHQLVASRRNRIIQWAQAQVGMGLVYKFMQEERRTTSNRPSGTPKAARGWLGFVYQVLVASHDEGNLTTATKWADIEDCLGYTMQTFLANVRLSNWATAIERMEAGTHFYTISVREDTEYDPVLSTAIGTSDMTALGRTLADKFIFGG